MNGLKRFIRETIREANGRKLTKQEKKDREDSRYAFKRKMRKENPLPHREYQGDDYDIDDVHERMRLGLLITSSNDMRVAIASRAGREGGATRDDLHEWLSMEFNPDIVDKALDYWVPTMIGKGELEQKGDRYHFVQEYSTLGRRYK